MARLEAKDILIVVGGDTQLHRESVNLTLETGMRLGVVGPNGSGKTTLLETLAGRRDLGPRPEARLAIDGRVTYVAQDAAWVNDDLGLLALVMSGRPDIERLLAGYERAARDVAENPRALKRLQRLGDEIDRLDAWGWEATAKAALTGLGFGEADFERKLGELSGGERHRALLAQALTSGADVLLLDEPTNHLDVFASSWLARSLAERDGVVVFSSHDRFLLDAAASWILDLAGGEVALYRGNYSRYLQNKAERLERLTDLAERQEAERERLEAYIRRYKAGNRATMAKSREKALARLPVVHVPKAARKARLGLPAASVRRVVTLSGVVAGWDEPLVGPVDARLEPGERLALVGPNGIGKSTLLRSLSGELPLLAGTVGGAEEMKIGYFAQDLGSLPKEAASVLDVVMGSGLLHEEARRLLAAWGFYADRMDVAPTSLSGGETNRLALLYVCLGGADLLILDEPTNHLDIDVRLALEEAISSFDGIVILASHDRAFLEAIEARILEIRRGAPPAWTVFEREDAGTLEELEQELRVREVARERVLSQLAGPRTSESRRRELTRQATRLDEEIKRLWAKIERAT